MLLLTTHWGDYNLTNLSRVDIFKAKANEIWETFVTFDCFKHCLWKFETERDAIVFCHEMRTRLREVMVKDNGCFDLVDLCKAALHEVEHGQTEQ